MIIATMKPSLMVAKRKMSETVSCGSTVTETFRLTFRYWDNDFGLFPKIVNIKCVVIVTFVCDPCRGTFFFEWNPSF